MSNVKRRKFLKASAAVAASAAAGPFIWVKDANAQWKSTPEKGAKLRVLRWSRFVQGDIDRYMVNVKKFTDKYGIEVRVDNEGWEDVRPEGGGGGQHRRRPRHHPVDQRRRAISIPDKLVDVTDVCNYLGRQVRRLVPGLRGLSQAGRQEVDRRAAGRRRHRHGLSRQHAQGRGLRQRSRRTPTASSSCARR